MATPTPPPWTRDLQKGTYRDVPFFVADTRAESGRRLSVFEFPLRDKPFIEDLGKKTVRFVVNAYILVGFNAATSHYFGRRNDFIAALAANGIGKLIHPYYGEQFVRVETYSMHESRDEGGIVYFNITFIVDNKDNNIAVSVRTDTAANVIGTSQSLLSRLQAEFPLLFKLAGYASFVQDSARILLATVHGNFGPLLGALGPPGSQSAFQFAVNTFQSVLSAGTDLVSSIRHIEDIFATFGIGITAPDALAAVTPALQAGVVLLPVSTFAPLVTSSRVAPIGETDTLDPTFGLAPFLNFGDDLPPVKVTTADTAQIAANQTAIVQGVRISAAATVAQIYAQTTFGNNKIAKSALDLLISALEDAADEAAFLGQDQLYLVLRQLLAAVIEDMNIRAVKLPQIVPYTVAGSLPSLALSQQLYQTSTEDQQLVALNNVPHPLFMPLRGEALTPQ